MLEINCTRAQYLSMILLKTHSSRLDYCVKRAESLMSGPQLYLFSMFTNFSKSSDVSNGTNTLATTSPSSVHLLVLNPKSAQVEACLYTAASFPSEQSSPSPHLPILLMQTLLKPPIYTIHHPHPSVTANPTALVPASLPPCFPPLYKTRIQLHPLTPPSHSLLTFPMIPAPGRLGPPPQS